MRLERLEISGFKSFSDRSELAFDQGVTAIVGPNGCGKSNVADAITWVLGEQSAKSLRGEKMEDVIFSGSDGRKPGATAEVRLHLSGVTGSASPEHVEAILTQAHEFTRDVDVTRRLYRSGESEYLIDGEVCRLRDVHELLMDTGLGAKAYAIIEQGKIGLILSSRPTDRRQLIEEAAGITKYKSRRRAAELKLEAAQQNLTRIDDIVFEVERQRGTLKRQSARARRYKTLREELRRWEKVLLARRYRELAQGIEMARARLAEAREREAVAASRVAEVESDRGRLRIEQAEADNRAGRVREEAHLSELDINRRQQQLEFDRHQAAMLASRASEIADEMAELEARREPARVALDARRDATSEATRARDAAAAVLAEANDAYGRSQQQIEGFEGDVEAARSELFSTLNSVTALHHAMEHATAQRERVGETLGKLDVEHDDLRREIDKVESDRTSASEAHARTHAALEGVHLDRATRESELATARNEHEWSTRTIRAREQELAGVEARLASIAELVSSRGEFGDAARMVLVQANGHVGQRGAVADYLDVDSRYERAVEACLGDLLQHVIVERHDQATAGLLLVREHDAGRCGFVVVDAGSDLVSSGYQAREAGTSAALQMPGVVAVAEVLRIGGAHAQTIREVLPEAYVAETFEQAVAASRRTSAPVATLDGDVLRGPHLISGGAKAESRGILATRREIKELRERIVIDREALGRLVEESAVLAIATAQATSAIAALHAERHRQEKEIVGHEALLTRAAEESGRLARKADAIALDRHRAEEERAALDTRYTEAHAEIGRLQDEQRGAEDRLADAQRRLAAGRDAVAELTAAAAGARAAHAGLVERTVALAAEVERLEEGARELAQRIASRGVELEQTHARRASLLHAVAEGERTLDDDIRALDVLRGALRTADEQAETLRMQVDAQEIVIREARRVLEDIRTQATEFDLARVTAESDLTHLAQTCADMAQCSLAEVLGEVEQMEASGLAEPDAAAISAEDVDPNVDADPNEGVPAQAAPVRTGSMSAEEAIVALKARIDRLGPVNMMAIEQYDELEARYLFLSTQRQDLIDSIAQTAEAIKRIDETTRIRFTEAFTAIQQNFQGTFSTLFGGGRAGLTLLDENDPLESGIDIIASPPGKRLQSVQLLSGGEKALTAIALMFAIFKYKPSPFCLLDEIDAPLDDANVSRFVDMLRGMLDHTQFILITHNRRTMEIANRLYGVTMEEPGVSKLISVQLN
ncbi:MAG: chromosome segregation protein SMC [Acidobacteria bacterium]|nr:chromosome segregation protein SMC [Acidobacteriota bacterium]